MKVQPNAFNILELDSTPLLLTQNFTPIEARYAIGMTQEALAGSLGLSLRQWQYFEKCEKPLPQDTYLALRLLIAIRSTSARKSSNSQIARAIRTTRERIKNQAKVSLRKALL